LQGSEGYASAISPDGKTIVTPSGLSNATVWRSDTGKKVLTLQHPTKAELRAVSFSSDGRYVL
jgi:WD40 repeat protein